MASMGTTGLSFLFCFTDFGYLCAGLPCQSSAALPGAFFFAAASRSTGVGLVTEKQQKQKQKNVFITAQGACPKRASFLYRTATHRQTKEGTKPHKNTAQKTPPARGQLHKRTRHRPRTQSTKLRGQISQSPLLPMTSL